MKEKEFKINNEDILHCKYLYDCTNRGYSCKNCIRNSNVNVFEGHNTDCFHNNTLENKTTGTKYIVKYAPIINNGYSKQDLETMVIISNLSTKEEVSETIRSNFDKANDDKSWYNGIYLSVQTVDEFLKTLPTYKL